MLTTLRRKNQEIIRNIHILEELIEEKSTPPELENYQKAILDIINEIKTDAQKNIKDLNLLKKVDIQDEVISDTQKVAVIIRLLSALQAAPIFRASDRDRVCLRIISWLHRQHAKVTHVPAAVSTNSWSILPFENLPIYYLPSIEQQQLIHLPLLFHEFGHLIYAHHKPEMNELVKELQQGILELLMPSSRRDDRLSKRISTKRQRIAFRWYSWTQELFCDAIGLSIGGPAFLYAFSAYLSNLHGGDFHGTEAEIEVSKHPINWLRVKFLVNRSNDEGYEQIASEIEGEWNKIAHILGITEDYYGYYDPIFDDLITNTLRDMLVIADVRNITKEEAFGKQWSPKVDSPVRLLNWAWQVFLSTPDNYTEWEMNKLQEFLEAPL